MGSDVAQTDPNLHKGRQTLARIFFISVTAKRAHLVSGRLTEGLQWPA